MGAFIGIPAPFDEVLADCRHAETGRSARRGRRCQGSRVLGVRPRADRTPSCRFSDGAHENPHQGVRFQSVHPEGRFCRNPQRRSFGRGHAIRKRLSLVAGRAFHGVPGPNEEVGANVHDPNPGRRARGLGWRRGFGWRRDWCAFRAAAAPGKQAQRQGEGEDSDPVRQGAAGRAALPPSGGLAAARTCRKSPPDALPTLVVLGESGGWRDQGSRARLPVSPRTPVPAGSAIWNGLR